MTESTQGVKQWLPVFFKGMAMGAADVVPGVSGGTIAFITGIYSRLIGAISRVDATLIQHVLKFRIKEAWQYLDASFLFVLAAGIATSIISLAHIVGYLLENHPVLVWSFFVGLVIASSVLLLKAIEEWRLAVVTALVAGIGLALVVNILRPASIDITLPYVFVCGMVAICAMLLPGISGSFLLLIFGVYTFVLDSIKSFDIAVIAVFGSGALIGLLSFAKLLNWALSRAQNLVLGFLTGVLMGSVVLIWPWKLETGEVLGDEHILTNVLPWTFEQATGQPSQLMFAVLLCAVAVGIVLALGRIKPE